MLGVEMVAHRRGLFPDGDELERDHVHPARVHIGEVVGDAETFPRGLAREGEADDLFRSA
jgi:hypothetical protein